MWRRNKMHPNRQPGNTLSEYGLIGALIIALALGGLMALGGSLNNALAGFNTGLKSRKIVAKPPQTGITASYNGQDANHLPGAQHNIVIRNPNTANPSLQILNNTGSNVVVAGIDGSRENTLGTIMLANTFDTLAMQEPNPETAAYIRKLAELSYYLGATQGVVDGVKTLAIPASDPRTYYHPASALSDIFLYHKEMTQLVMSPPTSIQPDTLRQLMPLANEVTKISQSYLDHYAPYINKRGEVSWDVSLDMIRGSGTVGGAFTTQVSGQYTFGTFYDQDYTYSELVPLQDLKNKAKKVLTDNRVESVKVEVTLTDAQQTDKMAETFEGISKQEQ
jgi:Flp pilus assembly pilin Flp